MKNIYPEIVIQAAECLEEGILYGEDFKESLETISMEMGVRKGYITSYLLDNGRLTRPNREQEIRRQHFSPNFAEISPKFSDEEIHFALRDVHSNKAQDLEVIDYYDKQFVHPGNSAEILNVVAVENGYTPAILAQLLIDSGGYYVRVNQPWEYREVIDAWIRRVREKDFRYVMDSDLNIAERVLRVPPKYLEFCTPEVAWG